MHRHDVWTDAGRNEGDLYLIASNIAVTPALNLVQLLQRQGWTAEVRPAQPPVKHRLVSPTQ